MFGTYLPPHHQAAPASEVRNRAGALAAPPPPPRVMGAVFDEVSHSLGGGNPEAARAVWTERWEFVRGSVDWDNCALSQRFIEWGRTYCDDLCAETAPPPAHPLEATPVEERIWGWGARAIMSFICLIAVKEFAIFYCLLVFIICSGFVQLLDWLCHLSPDLHDRSWPLGCGIHMGHGIVVVVAR